MKNEIPIDSERNLANTDSFYTSGDAVDLARLRKSKKLTQAEVATLTGLSVRTIQLAERGEVPPRTFSRILNELMGYSPPSTGEQGLSTRTQKFLEHQERIVQETIKCGLKIWMFNFEHTPLFNAELGKFRMFRSTWTRNLDNGVQYRLPMVVGPLTSWAMLSKVLTILNDLTEGNTIEANEEPRIVLHLFPENEEALQSYPILHSLAQAQQKLSPIIKIVWEKNFVVHPTDCDSKHRTSASSKVVTETLLRLRDYGACNVIYQPNSIDEDSSFQMCWVKQILETGSFSDPNRKGSSVYAVLPREAVLEMAEQFVRFENVLAWSDQHPDEGEPKAIGA